MIQHLSAPLFQSTHPVRGATRVDAKLIKSVVISIHAPREGCDKFIFGLTHKPSDFNPRTP